MKKLLIVLLSLSALSCQKEFQNSTIETPRGAENVIIPETFDWENIDYMPAPLGSNILIPWAFGSSRAFPSEFLDDIAKTDGWELVYNTFHSSQLPTTDAYIIFYNRYRGLLRGYFYNRKNENPSTYITHTLKMSPLASQSNLLAFSAQEIVNIDVPTQIVSIVQPFQTGPLGTWHAAEFELAYDPLTTQRQASQYFFTWEVNNKAISQIIINGQSSGTINGTIAQPNPPTNWGSTLVKGALNVIGTGGATLIADELIKGISSGTQGQVSTIINGIFGGKADSSYSYVNLKTSADYSFTGSSQSDVLLSSASLILPGSLGQNEVAGYTTLKNTPYGIFSIDRTPKMKINQQHEEYHQLPPDPTLDPRDPEYGRERTEYLRFFEISLDEQSYDLIFNPNVINNSVTGAKIENIRKDLIVSTMANPIDETAEVIELRIDNYPQKIIIDNTSYLTFPERADRYDDLPIIPDLRSTYLRISFDVVPNNGSQKTKIIKTFNVTI